MKANHFKLLQENVILCNVIHIVYCLYFNVIH